MTQTNSKPKRKRKKRASKEEMRLKRTVSELERSKKSLEASVFWLKNSLGLADEIISAKSREVLNLQEEIQRNPLVEKCELLTKERDALAEVAAAGMELKRVLSEFLPK